MTSAQAVDFINRHPILNALKAAVNDLPDGGEGSMWHVYSQAEWEIRDDYRRALEEDRTLAGEFDLEDPDITFDRLRTLIIADAGRLYERITMKG